MVLLSFLALSSPALISAAVARSCAFDYGKSDKPCCGQEGTGAPASDPHVCTSALPICTEYVYNHHFGWCANTETGTAFCKDCLESVIADKDVAGDDMDPCGPAGCNCASAADKCVGPVESGSEQHHAACCALCAITTGCQQWVVNGGPDAAVCWLKSKAKAGTASTNRAFGTVAHSYITQGCRSEADEAAKSFVWIVVLGFAAYLGGGVPLGMRSQKRGSGVTGLLRVHPHWERFVELHGLVLDGVRFARGGISSGRGATGGKGRQQLLLSSQEQISSPKSSAGKKRSTGKRSSDRGGAGNSGKTKSKKDRESISEELRKQSSEASLEPGVGAIKAAAPVTTVSGGRWVRVAD